MSYQTCTKCKACKPIERFYFIKRSQSHDSRCKECIKAYHQERRAEIPGLVEHEREVQERSRHKRKAANPSLGTWSTKTPAQKKAAYLAVKKWRANNAGRFEREAKLSLRLKRSWGYIKAWPAIVHHYGGKCLNCGSTDKMCFDHVVPLSKGGDNLITNGQPICVKCNTFKGQTQQDKDWRPDGGAWIRELARLNPHLMQMTEERPQGWHLTIKGRKELESMKGERGELVIPTGESAGQIA